MVGFDLIQILISSTGLPQESVRIELEKMIVSKGLRPEDITMADVRILFAEYLQDVLLQARSELGSLDSDSDLSV